MYKTEHLWRGRLFSAFAAIHVLWGSTYLAIPLAVQIVPPFLLIGARSIAAGAVLPGLAQLQHRGLPTARAWALSAASGILLFGFCRGALAFAGKFVPSGLAAVMLATVPFWIVLLRFMISAADRPKISTLIALSPGLAGVAVFTLSGPSQGTGASSFDPGMVLILLAAAFCWAAGSIISQRQPPAYRRPPLQACSSFAEARPS